MTSQQFLVCDSSTLANFKSWAQAISNFFTTAGWMQSTDTGQVNWGTIASVPGTGAYVYEIWEPNDGLTNFYAKAEYGNFNGTTNCPTVRLSISETTNGAGNLTGNVLGPIATTVISYTAPSTTATYECNFSGAAGRMGAMLWRNGANSCQALFAVERSVNASGAYTASYVTLYSCGHSGNNPTISAQQGTLLFGVGAAPHPPDPTGTTYGGWYVRTPFLSSTFNGAVAIDLATPLVGYFDYPGTMVGAAWGPDIVEGVTFNALVYGTSHTYMPSKNGYFAYNAASNGNWVQAAYGLVMRYD